MSNIKYIKIKQWLIFSSLVFGVGFGVNYAVNRDFKDALAGGGIGVVASSIGTLALDWRQRKPLIENFSSLQAKCREMEKRYENLMQSHTEKKSQLKQLKQELIKVEEALKNAGQQQEQLEDAQKRLEQQRNQLENKASEQESQIQDLRLETQKLEQERQQLNTTINLLTEQQHRRQELEEQLTRKWEQVQALQGSVEDLTDQLDALAEQKTKSEEDIKILQVSKEQLNIEIADLKDCLKELNRLRKHQALKIASENQSIIISNQDVENIEDANSKIISAELSSEDSHLSDTRRPNDDNSILGVKTTARPQNKFISYSQKLDFDLKNSHHSQKFWDDEVLPKWKHSDRPIGQRFLGSVKIDQDISDYLLQVIGENLRQLDSLTYDRLYQEFNEPKQSWLKLLTLALSEYAYYYSADRFWEGFCEHLDLPMSQSVENTLRKIVLDGINKLGLIKSQSGYTYVSTLWLQSGIPKQNLNHFAQLVQEVSDTCGWWELAHTDSQELAHTLMDFSQSKHAAWGTLNNFLRVSCSEQTDDNALSGQLVKGIAMVAQQLEEQGQSPQILLDPEQREDLLSHYYLPSSFFLRDWSTVATVLTPKPSSSGHSLRRRQRSLSLQLEIETLNTQLVLPEQKLWQRDWRDLRGTFCQITEAEWEDVMPREGDLAIPELAAVVDTAAAHWEWHLQNHRRDRILTWPLLGIDPQLPCLLFDAVTGEHIPLTVSALVFAGKTSVACFLPKDWQLELGEDIDVLDSYLPSSIRGWRGQELEITAEQSSLAVSAPNDGPTTEIIWQRLKGRDPILLGLKLRGQKPIYLGKPILQYPPQTQNQTVNLLIESTSQKRIVARQLEQIAASDRWSTIQLDDSIALADTYELKVWTETQEWPSSKFEVRSPHQLTEPPPKVPIQISHSVAVESGGEGSQVQTSDHFWADEIAINGLWPLEMLTFELISPPHATTYVAQADRNGQLIFKVASLYGQMPQASYYRLTYARLGLPNQALLSLGQPPQQMAWELTPMSLRLANLATGEVLTCWNLLVPEFPDQEIAIAADEQAEIPLPSSPGIYYLQLRTSEALTPLGWWCSSDQYALPTALQNEKLPHHDALENYCYALLGNESIDAFAAAVDQLSPELRLAQLESGLAALQTLPIHFPDWLDKDLLIAKMNLLVDQARSSYRVSFEPKVGSSPPPPDTESPQHSRAINSQLQTGKWYLITVQPYKRDLFLTHLEDICQQKEPLSTQIHSIRKCRADYPNSVLLQVDDAAKRADLNQMLRQVAGFQAIERRPLALSDVERMLEDDA